VEFSATVTRRLPAASVLAVVLFALPLLASTPPASASNLKTRVWDFFEDRTLCTDGERDLSQQSSLGKTASNASDCGGRNLFYNRFRYYDPAVGRYISPDPIGLLGGANVYLYPPNINGWVDPYGLAKKNTQKCPATGGTGAKYNKKTGQGIYVLRDRKTGQVKYVGRGDAPVRTATHKRTKGKKSLDAEVVWANDLTKAQAKGIEQALIDYYGGAKSVDRKTPLQNKIRSYSDTNPNATTYDKVLHTEVWQETLERLGEA
jgi:RHS repeat-associated protein